MGGDSMVVWCSSREVIPWLCGVHYGRRVHGAVELIVGGVSMVLWSSSWEVSPWWCGVHRGR